MHATFHFLMNYEDQELPDLSDDEMRKSWMIEEAVRLMMSAPQASGSQITSENFEESLDLYMKGLDEKWKNMPDDEKRAAENYEREKEKYRLIAEDLDGEIESEYIEHYGDDNNWWQSEMAIFKNGMIAPLCEIDDYRGRGWVYWRFLRIKRENRWDEAIKNALRTTAYDFDVPGLNHFNFGQEETEQEKKLNSMSISELQESLEYYAPRFMAKRLMEYLAVVISRGRGKNMGEVNIGDLINIIYPPDSDAVGSSNPLKALAVLDKTQKEPNWMGDWHLKNALEVYQAWESATYSPFTFDLNSPYHNYRCYDLRDWTPIYEHGNKSNEGWIDSHTKTTPRRADDFIEENSAIVMVDIHT